MVPAKFDIALIDHIPPWTIIGTRALSDALQLDRCALNMWIYRGRGPANVPASWLKGRSAGFFGYKIRHWLGDDRAPEAMFRGALEPLLGPSVYEEVDDVMWIHALVQAKASKTVTMGIDLTPAGLAAYGALVNAVERFALLHGSKSQKRFSNINADR